MGAFPLLSFTFRQFNQFFRNNEPVSQLDVANRHSVMRPMTGLVAGAAMVLLTAHSAFAQGFGGGRAATVEVSPAVEEVLANTVDVQGRVAGGGAVAITAFANAEIEVEALRLGDMVTAGQTIAKQDATSFGRRLTLLELQLADARLRVEDITQDIAGDEMLLTINQEQLALLEKKAARANDLASRNALSTEAAETALGASLSSRQALYQRKSAIVKKEFQLKQAVATIERIKTEITQVKADIKDLTIATPSAGQISFISPLSKGFSRQGDVIARIVNIDDFEVEAEIPVAHVDKVRQASVIMATGVNDESVALSLRAVLPTQNARTGTRTMRFSVNGKLPVNLQAIDAVVVLRIPVSMPEPVVTIAKDAVIPIAGGHVLYVAEEGVAVRRRITLGNAVGDSFVVLDGLKAGEQVVVRGNEALNDGKAIKIGGDGAVKQKRKKPAGEEWLLEWTTRRGPASADLLIGKDKSSFNGEEITVVRAGDSINFIGQLFLPFGTLDLEFQGTIAGDKMEGPLTLRGLPGGRELELTFTGTKVVN